MVSWEYSYSCYTAVKTTEVALMKFHSCIIIFGFLLSVNLFAVQLRFTSCRLNSRAGNAVTCDSCVWASCLWFAGIWSVFPTAGYSHLQTKLELPGGPEHQTQVVPQGKTRWQFAQIRLCVHIHINNFYMFRTLNVSSKEWKNMAKYN